MKTERVAGNTVALYARQIVLTLINLYSVRILLNTFGVEDFGIYTVVSGVVALASFLPAAMSSATQRYFSFAIGNGNLESITGIFSSILVIFFGIGVVSFLGMETVGLWFVEEMMAVPEERAYAAIVLYQISIFVFLASLLATPYVAIIIAHEDMRLFALISIIEALLKLGGALILGYLPADNLPAYGIVLLIASTLSTGMYIYVCKKTYAGSKFVWNSIEIKVLKDIFAFTSWTLFGQMTTVFRNQAVTILVNQAFNPTVAAARAISMAVANQVAVFASNFNTSLYPPIVKLYSAQQKDEMYEVIYWGSRMTFFLMWILFLPLFLEMDMVLSIWLDTPPVEASIFTRLALIESLIVAISLPLTAAARAPGVMGVYEFTLGSLQLLIFVGSLILLNLGYPATSVFIVAIVVNITMFFVRLYIVSWLTGLECKSFLKNVVSPCVQLALITATPMILIQKFLPQGLFSSVMLVLTSVLVSFIAMYVIGINRELRRVINRHVQSFYRRVCCSL